jgi:PAS domain S-box-containing protein
MNDEREAARLRSLAEYDILDSERELAYDDLAQLAAEICCVPIAMITIIDEKRQWTKAQVGVDLVEVDRSYSFCNHTIQQRELLVVPDTSKDARFADNPFVKDNPNVRFYAGYPLISREGEGLGSLCVVDTKIKELSASQMKSLAALGRQVTAQLELRRRLRENEEALARQHQAENERDRFFQATVDMLTIHKLGETTYRQMNDSWERTLGYTIDELRAGSFLQFIHPDDIEPSRVVLGGLSRGLDVFGFRNRYRHRDGSWRWLEWQAFAPPAGEDLVYAVARDVTSQVEAAEKLRQKTQELETVFNVFPDLFFQLDETGVILDYHGGHATDAGPFGPDCVGRRFTDILPAEIARRLKAAKEEARRTQAPQQIEFSIDEIGGERSFEVRILSANGREVIVVIRDITDRALADRAQLEAKQAAESASRSKSDFLASMSHELRTPLNAVLNISESLTEGVYGPVTEKQRHSLQTIAESGRHLLGLINDILDLSKIEAGKLDLQLSRVLIQPLCEASLRLVREQALLKSQEVFLSISPKVTALEADERKLKQILVNLLSNAIKFTPEGGRVGLEVGAAGDLISFTVWDSGIGIAQDDIRKLFLPFVQLDSKLSREYAGTGLGLSLAQRLATLHGGRIEVQSTPGEGSRFTAFLPAGSTAVTTILNRAKTQSLPRPAVRQGDGPRVLLVEDTEANRECIGDYLMAKGFRVQFAVNGAEAIHLATSGAPDLILMDIQMSGMDGFEAIRRLRQNPKLARTPIIALTALAMEGDSERCLAAGATHYLSKPIALKELVCTLHSILEEAPRSVAAVPS